MLEHEYHTMRHVEDTYWWYRTLRSLVIHEMQGKLADRPGRVLDAGCGTGGMMEHLRAACPALKISGVDNSPEAVQITRERGFSDVSVGSVSETPFAPASFDAVISLDVLCQQKVNHTKALEEFHRILAPGGVLVLNLPAFDFLSGRHDKAVLSARRYMLRDTRALLVPAGFRVEKLHYWNAWLFVPILFWRLFSRFRLPEDFTETKSDLTPLAPRLNNTLAALSKADASLCRAFHLPFGTSLFAVATRI